MKKNKSIKTICGREYLSDQFRHLKMIGRSKYRTMFGTPQQNSVINKRNHILFDMVWSMVAQFKLHILRLELLFLRYSLYC